MFIFLSLRTVKKDNIIIDIWYFHHKQSLCKTKSRKSKKEAVMTQTRYTLQQHHVNLKSSVKLSHVNMYHCESPASNIFPGHPYSKIIFIQKGQDNFISAINFYRFEKMIYYWWILISRNFLLTFGNPLSILWYWGLRIYLSLMTPNSASLHLPDYHFLLIPVSI